jgi:hypothetical protein
LRPVPDKEAQRYLLRRDGYSGTEDESCTILIKAHCRGVAYDPYDWPANPRTYRFAHDFVANNWPSWRNADLQGQRTTGRIHVSKRPPEK